MIVHWPTEDNNWNTITALSMPLINLAFICYRDKCPTDAFAADSNASNDHRDAGAAMVCTMFKFNSKMISLHISSL